MTNVSPDSLKLTYHMQKRGLSAGRLHWRALLGKKCATMEALSEAVEM